MNSTDSEKLSLALVSAYVWVASADDGVVIDEYNKFQKVILESQFATHFNIEDLRHTFKDMVGVFQTNYDYGINLTCQRIRYYSNEPIIAEEILRLARAAVVADGQIKDVEENVLDKIKKELNFS